MTTVAIDALSPAKDWYGGNPRGVTRVRPIALARAAWVALVILILGIFVAAIPALYTQRSAPPVAVEAGLAELGLSVGAYAAYWTGLHLFFGAVYFAAAALIVRRRSNERMALFVSAFLVLLGGANAPLTEALVWLYPFLAVPVTLVFFLTVVCLVLFFFVFPDGRFIPRQGRIPLAVWAAVVLVAFLIPLEVAAEGAPFWPLLTLLAGLGAGLAAQAYRYVRVSGPEQRRQTRWVVVGGAIAVVGQAAGGLLPGRLPVLTPAGSAAFLDLLSVTIVVIAFLAIPLSIGLAVLRYQLWDIVVVVNRTLVYGTLTASVVAIYVLIVGGLGTLVQGTGNPVVGLLATGVAAVLFQPLREHLQRGVNRLLYGERGDPYRVLSSLGQRLEATLQADAILPTIVGGVREALKLPYVAIELERNGVALIAAASGSPVKEPFRLSLTHRGEAIGALLLGSRSGEEAFGWRDRQLLEDIARQAGAAVHAARLTEDLQRSRERLVSAREEERRRLRRDLHDGLGPRLASLTLRLETARDRLAEDARARALLDDLAERTRETVTDVRRLVYALRPPALDDLGLVTALREAATQYVQEEAGGLQVTVSAPERLPALPAATEVAAYRIAQEALTNVVRHARARHCALRLDLEAADETLRVEVTDDGRGIESGRRVGVGLASMRERAEELGGSLTVERQPAGGTRVCATLPCRATDEGRSAAAESASVREEGK